MKHLKRRGLAVIAAFGLMAFVGAGTASATTLFTNSNFTSPYPAGMTVHLSMESGASWVTTDTSGNTISTCTEAIIHGTTTIETGTWVGINIGAFTWEGCNQTTDTVGNGSLEIMWTSGTSGEIVGKGSKVTQNIFGVSCVYGTGEGTKLGTITGGEAPTMKITATIPRIEGGFLCPTTSVWHTSLVFTSPHAFYVGS